jgi:hypothetical protein
VNDEAPSWDELRTRLNTATFATAAGALRWHDRTDEPYGPAEGRCRFLFARGDRLRVEDGSGPLHVQDEQWALVRDGRGRMVRHRVDAHDSVGVQDGHPWTLIGHPHERGELFTGEDDFCTAAGPARAVAVAGRPGWQVELVPPRRKPHPLILVVDDATGILLRMSGGPGGDAFVVEMTELSTDVEVDDASFRWTGQYVDAAVVAEEWAAERQRNRPRDEESLARARERLRILEILAQAVRRRHEVSDTIAAAPGLPGASAALAALLGVTPEETMPVLDMQFRRLCPPESAKIHEELADLRAYLDPPAVDEAHPTDQSTDR